jgi:hypothetical protein
MDITLMLVSPSALTEAEIFPYKKPSQVPVAQPVILATEEAEIRRISV